jgi:hypothetical protein
MTLSCLATVRLSAGHDERSCPPTLASDSPQPECGLRASLTEPVNGPKPKINCQFTGSV